MSGSSDVSNKPMEQARVKPLPLGGALALGVKVEVVLFVVCIFIKVSSLANNAVTRSQLSIGETNHPVACPHSLNSRRVSILIQISMKQFAKEIVHIALVLVG